MTESFDPEQTGNAALIAALSIKRGLPPRAATIALTTAYQESKILNITYGDRDSLGLFQQRPSQGWGTEKQIMDPVYSTNKFYDALVKVKGYENADITEIAQKVQRSGFPGGLPGPRGPGPRPRLGADRPLPRRAHLQPRGGNVAREACRGGGRARHGDGHHAGAGLRRSPDRHCAGPAAGLGGGPVGRRARRAVRCHGCGCRGAGLGPGRPRRRVDRWCRIAHGDDHSAVIPAFASSACNSS